MPAACSRFELLVLVSLRTARSYFALAKKTCPAAEIRARGHALAPLLYSVSAPAP